MALGWRCEFRQARGKADGKAGARGKAGEPGAGAATWQAARLTAEQATGQLAAELAQGGLLGNWTVNVADKTLTDKQMTVLPVRISGQVKHLISSVSRCYPPPPASTNSERGLLPQEIRPFTGRGRPFGRPLLEKPSLSTGDYIRSIVNL